MPEAHGSAIATVHKDAPNGQRAWLNDPIERAQWLERVLCECFGMDERDARMICGVVIDEFGDKKEVLDDQLSSDVRSIFYTLESKRILTFRRIEYEGEEGQTLRGFFWRFHAERIEKALQENEDCADMAQDGVYEDLPASVWERSAA